MKEGFIGVEEHELWTIDSGNGPAEACPLVFIHGMTLDSRSWALEIETNAPTRRVLAYDLAGFGRSSIAERTTVDAVCDLHRLLAALGLTRPILVGLSLGANVALAFARAYPKLVAGLVLASPGLPGHRWSTERPPEVAGRLARSESLEAAKAYWLQHAMFASLADHPEAQKAVASMVGDYAGWHWLHASAIAPIPPMADELASLDLPILVVNGAHDLEEYRNIGSLIAERAPNARRVEIKDAGHVVNLEAPEVFQSLLDQFADFVDQRLVGATLPPPITFDLREPGTFVYTGMDATRGEALNAFALSLRDPGERREFLLDEAGYMTSFDLPAEQVEQVLERDWTGLLRSGGHLQAILKLAATVGQSLWDIGAHNARMETRTLVSICPRRVASDFPAPKETI